MTPLAAELNSFGCRLIVRMSAYWVIAQKPGPSASSCQCTGSCLTQPGVLVPRMIAAVGIVRGEIDDRGVKFVLCMASP